VSRSFTVPLASSVAVACLLLAPAPAAAQAAGESASAEPPAAGLTPLAPGEIRVRAESYEQVAKGHLEARGTVDLRLSGMRVFADRADVFEETRKDGSLGRRVVAEGNVVFLRGSERLSGDRAEIDESGRGVFLNAVGYVEPGVFIEARRIERVDADTYRVLGGSFSSCTQANPRWNFTASRATIDVDDKIRATHAVFRVKGVPAFYAPYIYYPIRKDHRSTGLLFPRFGHSSYRGFEVGAGFFWAMGRSADQTFHFDSYSQLGYGFGHELRWALRSPSRGDLRSYVLDARLPQPAAAAETAPETAGPAPATRTLDYDIDWTVLQALPGRVRGSLNVRQTSDLLSLQRFQDSFNGASSRSERLSGALERDLGIAVVSAYAESNNTYFYQTDPETGTPFTVTYVSGLLPGLSLRRFPRQIGWGGVVFGLNAAADRYRYGNQNQADPAARPPATWERYDLAPTLSRPLRVSFLDLNPSVGYRYTRYSASNGVDADGLAGIVGPPMGREFFEASLDLRGPTFSRVFDTPGIGYSERFKHTIGPEVTWTYRTRVDRFSDIPKSPFGDDYHLGTDELRYALVQRFYAKRRGPTGKLQPYEFFSWRLMQTYYLQIKEGQDNFDPNYSSSAFGPGSRPEHLSPLMSRMRLRPSPDASLDYNLEYDVNFRQVRRMSAIANVTRSWLQLNASWTRSLRQSEIPAERFVGAETLRGSTAFDLWPRHLSLEGSVDYDLKNEILYQMRAQLRYSVQCCGFLVEHVRYNWNTFVNSQWRFSLELANVGSVGTSAGGPATGGRYQ
jgi:hypothetical protein